MTKFIQYAAVLRRNVMEAKNKYFEQALSDFTFDVSCGAAIRHLVDLEYSVKQIMHNISYSPPQAKVEKAVYRYMMESGVLTYVLPKDIKEYITIQNMCEPGLVNGHIREMDLRNCITEKRIHFGRQDSYVSCPFGIWSEEETDRRLACLDTKERDYIQGIPWEHRILYHRLTGRMEEIGIKLWLGGIDGVEFYFAGKM